MKKGHVRVAVEIPAGEYRQLEELAARRGCSVQELILIGVEKVLAGRRRVRFPIIRSRGPKVAVSSEMIYRHIEFP